MVKQLRQIACALTCLLIYSNVVAEQALFGMNALPVSIGVGSTVPLSVNGFDKASVNTSFTLASYAVIQDDGVEHLTLDGEIALLQIEYSQPLSLFGRVTNLQFAGGFIHHGRGHLDSLVNSWHDLFGLDPGDRPLLPIDGLLYQYKDENGNLNEARKSTSGLTDTTIQISTQIGNNTITKPQISTYLAYAALHLPTGDIEKLSGSEQADMSIGMLGSWDLGWRWKVTADFSYLLIGDSQKFGIPTKSGALQANVASSRKLKKGWSALAELQYRGSIFESNLSVLSEASVQLNLGMRKELGSNSKSTIEVYFSEDLAVNRSADFALGVRWSKGF